MSITSPTLDPGKIRGLQRVTSEAGFFEICALDHLSDFAELLSPDPSAVTFADVVTAKDELVRALSPSVSAFLLDARYGLHTVATKPNRRRPAGRRSGLARGRARQPT